jgi:hypothetical protein
LCRYFGHLRLFLSGVWGVREMGLLIENSRWSEGGREGAEREGETRRSTVRVYSVLCGLLEQQRAGTSESVKTAKGESEDGDKSRLSLLSNSVDDSTRAKIIQCTSTRGEKVAKKREEKNNNTQDSVVPSLQTALSVPAKPTHTPGSSQAVRTVTNTIRSGRDGSSLHRAAPLH